MIIDPKNKLNDLHELAKPKFSKFLTEVQAKGFNIRINGVYYPYKDGVKLHAENPKNPIMSYHTFGFAVDMNITLIDTDKMYMKADKKEDWVNTGVPEIAKNNGLFWGGNYVTYYDPIHFEYQVLPFPELYGKAKEQFGVDIKAEYNKIKI